MPFDLMPTTDVVRQVIETVLSSQQYDADQLHEWNRKIIDACQRSLAESYPSFRTIVSTIILPQNDEQMHLSCACRWDFPIDGSTIVQ